MNLELITPELKKILQYYNNPIFLERPKEVPKSKSKASLEIVGTQFKKSGTPFDQNITAEHISINSPKIKNKMKKKTSNFVSDKNNQK